MRHIVPAAIRDLLVTIALVLLVPAAAVAQVTLQPGDILVLDPFGGSTGAVVRVDPATGTQTQVTADNLLTDITATTIAADGRIYVTDCGCAGPPSIVRVDAATGGQNTVSTGGFLASPTGIAVDPASGDLVVVDTGTLTVFRVDPTTGAQTLVSAGGLFADPRGIAIGPTGDFFVVDPGVLAVFRVTPAGVQSLVSSNQFFDTPVGIAVAANGTIYVADACSCAAVIAIDPAGASDSNQTVVTSGGLFAEPLGIAIAANGTLVVADGGFFSTPQVVAVDPVTGAQTVVSDTASPGAQLVMPAGVTVVPGFTLTVSLAGAGTGTVTSDVPGIICPGDCTELYVAGALAVATDFTGGVRVAAGNVDGGDRASIIVGAGPGGAPRVRVLKWLGATLAELASFFAFDPAFPGGVFVGAGDVTGDGLADVIAGAGAGGAPHVRVFTGSGADTGVSFAAYDPAFLGGVTVSASP